MSAVPDRPLLEVRDLIKTFRRPGTLAARLAGRTPQIVHALNGVSFTVRRGETLGIVGESGCGKSTLARCLVRLYDADSGSIRFDGIDVVALQGADLRRYNRRVQMVFQDPYGSLNPRMTVRQILAEALHVHALRSATQIPERVHELLALVGLPAEAAERYPHEFSGGQRQRICIARALSVEPDCLVADEFVSALDASVQAQIVNLLLELQERLDLTVLFVAHDLRLVRHISHRVAVMYLGSIVELAETTDVFARPNHPYTAALLAAAPDLDPARISTVDAVRGELPSSLAMPAGCPFHPRCRYVFDRCKAERPALLARAPEHYASCHLPAAALKPQ